MPTLKPVLKDYSRQDNKKQIFIRVIHRRKTNFVATGYYISTEYIRKDNSISPHYTNYTKLKKALNSLMIEFESIILDIPDLRKITVNELCARLRNKPNTGDFYKYFESKMAGVKKESTRQTYNAALTAFKGFRDTLTFNDITPRFVKDLETWLRTKLSDNSSRNYLYKLRLVYNEALAAGAAQGQPVTIGIRKTKNKRMALEPDELRKLFKVNHFAVDFFKLSFYLGGINTRDLLYLPPSDNYIVYKRAKIEDKQDIELRIKIQPEANEIIQKYAGQKYLLRYLDKDDSFQFYHSRLSLINIHLKRIGEELGLSTKLTTGLTRHTWSTLAKRIGVSDSDIDLALGHNLNSMTGGYISYQQLFERVDRANERVIEAVKN